MKLEVGMYVRFKKGKITYIRRLLEVIHNYEEFNVYRTVGEYFDYEEKDYFDIVYPDEIIGNPSYNIIDLIEVGDYVNGMKVSRVSGTRYDKNDLHCYCDDNFKYNNNYELKQVMISAKDIKSVVTKEQFESMEYEVE